MSLKKVYVLIVAFVFSSLAISQVAFAQQGEGGNGLQISPTRSDISGQPGEQKTITIIVKNITQGALTAQGVINDFESDNTTGTPKIIVDESKSSPYSIKKMVEGLNDFDLEPGESKEVKLTLNVPANASPGAYFGVVRYIASPKGQAIDKNTVQVTLTASVAHLVFLEVPGEVNEQIKLESLELSTENGSPTSLFFNSPTKSKLTVKNLGNGLSRPFGNVTIFSSSNKEVFKYDVNKFETKGIVLPNSTRVFEDKIENIKTPGKYKAVASVAYGNGGEVVNFEKSFWYLPLWFLGVLALVVILLVGGGYFVYRKYLSAKFGKNKD